MSYIVMRMTRWTNIEVVPLHPRTKSGPVVGALVTGCEGFFCVFDTRENAEAWCEELGYNSGDILEVRAVSSTA